MSQPFGLLAFRLDSFLIHSQTVDASVVHLLGFTVRAEVPVPRDQVVNAPEQPAGVSLT